MRTLLSGYPESGEYFLTTANVPAIMSYGVLREYHEPETPPTIALNHAGARRVSRFEFLAHLAAQGQSSLYRLGGVLIATRGFAGPHGWAFERGPDDHPGNGSVRIATRSERDAEGTQLTVKVERSRFAEETCYGRTAQTRTAETYQTA
jgi:hypothetical protein